MLATTATEPNLTDTIPDEDAVRRGRLAAWIAALLAPAVVGPIWCAAVPTWWGSLSALVLILLLAACAVTDTWQRRILNWATYSAVLWGIGINLWASFASGDDPAAPMRLVGPAFLGAVGISDAMAGMGVALLIGLPAYMAGMIAAGDIKLSAAVATVLGWKLGLMAICTSLVLAGGAAACWTIWMLGPLSALEWLARTIGFQILPTLIAPPSDESKASMERPMPLGMFFAIGVPLALILGEVR